jgi:hypothetical protein
MPYGRADVRKLNQGNLAHFHDLLAEAFGTNEYRHRLPLTVGSSMFEGSSHELLGLHP